MILSSLFLDTLKNYFSVEIHLQLSFCGSKIDFFGRLIDARWAAYNVCRGAVIIEGIYEVDFITTLKIPNFSSPCRNHQRF